MQDAVELANTTTRAWRGIMLADWAAMGWEWDLFAIPFAYPFNNANYIGGAHRVAAHHRALVTSECVPISADQLHMVARAEGVNFKLEIHSTSAPVPCEAATPPPQLEEK